MAKKCVKRSSRSVVIRGIHLPARSPLTRTRRANVRTVSRWEFCPAGVRDLDPLFCTSCRQHLAKFRIHWLQHPAKPAPGAHISWRCSRRSRWFAEGFR